jgi:flagellar biosynthesis protein FlhA
MTSPIAATTVASLPGERRGGSLPGTQARGAAKTKKRSAGSFELKRLASGDLAVPIGVLGILIAMVMPLPPVLLDLLLSANITLSVVVLMVAMYIRRPAEFSVFPTTLLLMTLFRLALNVSSARLILLNGSQGTSAAGHVIESFGNFVVGGNYVVGVVIFLVLIAIQYVVINHGAVRISEVTARFTLDALPGKQMSIDADLNAGLINESEAKARRKALSGEAEFYGAMDGATRFTQRDAIASLLITGINIAAGFLIGVLQHGMELKEALATYTVLTIGDGLVTVIPALMISISGGLIVTRAGSDMQMGEDFERQLFADPQPLWLTAGVLLLLGALPGLPKIPFLLLSATTGAFAWRLRQRQMRAEGDIPAPNSGPPRENLDALLRIEPIAVELGLGLVSLAEGGQNAPLLRRVAAIRRQLATELGFLLPPLRIADNLSLKAREYAVQLKGIELTRYELMPGHELAIPSSGGPPPAGIATREPAFGLPAVWISADATEPARSQGCTVVDPLSVLSAHLAETIRRNAHELFTRQDTKRLLDRVAEENPKVVEDLVPKLLPLATVQRVLQNLLRERVSIRDAVSILESLTEAASLTRNPILMTEFVRQSMRRAIVKPYLDAAGHLAAFLLDPALEEVFERAAEHGETTSQFHLPPAELRSFTDKVGRVAGEARAPVVLLAGAMSRHFVRQILEGHLPQVMVVAHGEVPPGLRVVSLGLIQ